MKCQLCGAPVRVYSGGEGTNSYERLEPEKIAELEQQLAEARTKIDQLQDFAIWMTGCGYDFCQHEYFCKQRDDLLKDHIIQDKDGVTK